MSAESLIGRGLLGEDRLIEVSHGRRLRAMLAGTGDDLVALESGLGSSSFSWGPVHASIARHARVVAYGRAGLDASTPAPMLPRDLAHLADDLHSVIDTIPHRRLVLVGHSWGGPIVRTLAARLLARGLPLDGLVLVDQSDEHAVDLYTSRLARWSGAIQNALMVPLARTHLLSPLMRTQIARLPRPFLRAALASSGSLDAARTVVAENRHINDELRRLHDDPLHLGDVGISVISAQRRTVIDRRMREQLIDAHRATVDQYPGGRFVPAERSGHMIPVTEPELIAAEALSFLR